MNKIRALENSGEAQTQDVATAALDGSDEPHNGEHAEEATH